LILAYQETKDWKEALTTALPIRKKNKVKNKKARGNRVTKTDGLKKPKIKEEEVNN
jgi:hypothetical protein